MFCDFRSFAFVGPENGQNRQMPLYPQRMRYTLLVFQAKVIRDA